MASLANFAAFLGPTAGTWLLSAKTRYPYGVPEQALVASGVADVLPVASVVVFVTTGSADAMTLALPRAGVYNAQVPKPNLGEPYDDGQTLIVVSTTLFAHTITTPTNGVNGSKHIITFGALAVANFVTLIAFNGSWWVVGSLNATVT